MCCLIIRVLYVKIVRSWDFPGGLVVKNLPSSDGDPGSIPDWGTKNPTNQTLTGEAVPLLEGNMVREWGHGKAAIPPHRANTPLAKKLRHQS